jgi:hypothetical protein
LSSLAQMIVLLDSARKMTDQIGGSDANLARGDDARKIGGNFGLASVMFSKDASTAQKSAAAVQAAASVYSGAMEVWAAASDTASKKTAVLGATMAGAKAGAAFGPYGAAIGAAAGALVGFIRTLSAGRREVIKFADAFDTMADGSGFDELRQKLNKLGDEGERLWVNLTQKTRKGDTDAARKAIKEIEEAFRLLEEQEQLVAEVLAKIEGKFADLMDATNEFGQRAPTEMHGFIDELLEMNGLTEEQIRLLKDLKAAPDWQSMEEAAGRLGVQLGNLGPAFQQGKLSDAALGVVRDLKLLEQGGANMTAVLKDAKGKLQELVTTAMTTGSQLPETLRPYIQKLIDMELLLDPGGQLIKNIDQLSFADIEDQVLLDIKGILEDIRDLLRDDLPDAASHAQRALDGLHVPDLGPVTWGGGQTNVPAPGGGYVPGTSDGTGYFPDGSIDPEGPYGYQLPQMARGGMVRATPGGTAVILGEGGEDEWVIPASKMGGGTVYNVVVHAEGSYFRDRESMDDLAVALIPSITRAATVFVSR